jgi:hypothetical protein
MLAPLQRHAKPFEAAMQGRSVVYYFDSFSYYLAIVDSFDGTLSESGTTSLRMKVAPVLLRYPMANVDKSKTSPLNQNAKQDPYA